MYYNRSTPRYDVVRFLGEVHEQIRYKLVEKKMKGKDEQEKAKKIQSFLNILINYPKQKNRADEMLFANLRYNLKNIMEKNENTKDYYHGIKSLFERRGESSAEVGEIFEQELEAIIQTFFIKASGINSFRLGQDAITVPGVQKFIDSHQKEISDSFYRDCEEIALKENKKLMKELEKSGLEGEKLEKTYNKKKLTTIKVLINSEKENRVDSKVSNTLYDLLPQSISRIKTGNSLGSWKITAQNRAGKTDIFASDKLKEFDWIGEATYSKEIIQGLDALKGAKISAKSYKDLVIGLGDTNFYKVFFSVLNKTSRSYSNKTKYTALYHLFNLQKSNDKGGIETFSYKRINEKDAKQSKYYPQRYGDVQERWKQARIYIYMMRFIYELTGAGSVYTNSALRGLEEVDFLVVNRGKNIKVYSTGFLIQKALNSISQPANINKYMAVRSDPFRGEIKLHFDILGIN